MFSENIWKVILLMAASVCAVEPSRALSIYQKPRTYPMFIPKNRKKLRSRVIFLDEDENSQPLGRGEIDLTNDKYTKIKFDDTTDYDFTSPDVTESPKDKVFENERFYDPRLRLSFPRFYQGRFNRPYAPNFAFEPFQPYAPPRTGFIGSSLPNPNLGWKARSPRVVFPYTPDSNNNLVQTNSHGGPTFNDNVVFRDQNVGIKPVKNDDQNPQTLQDIGDGADAFTERGKSNLNHN
ncbi:unnamed protein product, partial [Brenthis ino]